VDRARAPACHAPDPVRGAVHPRTGS
jgi:hypothetical protein